METLLLRIKIIPKSNKTGWGAKQKDGSWSVLVKEPAANGKANKALIAFLANAFGTSADNIKIVLGKKRRTKCIKILNPTKLVSL